MQVLTYLFFQTYCVDNQTPDSACTASAIFSGVKTNYDTLGYDSTVEKDNPASVTSSNEVTTVLKWAQESGRNTGNSLVLPKQELLFQMSLFYISLGLVTTTRVTHATPAALYAHAVNRDYECDGEIPQEDTDSKGKIFQKNYFFVKIISKGIIYFRYCLAISTSRSW